MSSKLNLDVEIARLFGFVCVATAHANSLGVFENHQTTGFVIDELCRASVQIFFMVSGFFWKAEQIDRPLAYLGQLFPKIAIPFVIWAAIYIFLDATQLIYPRSEERTWFSYATTPWSGGIAFHLWFLPALLVGTAIGLGLIRKLGVNGAMIAVLLLFLVGVLLGSYINLLGVTLPLSVYRNGIFFAPIFLVTGYFLKTQKQLPSLATFTVMALFGASLNMLEGLYVVRGFPHGHDLSLATLPFGVGVFGMFLHLNSSATWLAKWGRDVFGAYLAHVLILKILIVLLVPAESPALMVTCIVLTIILSLALSRLAKQNRFTRLLAP